MFFALLYSVVCFHNTIVLFAFTWVGDYVVNFKYKIIQGMYTYLAIFGMKNEKQSLQTRKQVS